MDIIYNPRQTQEILVCLAGGYEKQSKKKRDILPFLTGECPSKEKEKYGICCPWIRKQRIIYRDSLLCFKADTQNNPGKSRIF
jgi:hypothetical protein